MKIATLFLLALGLALLASPCQAQTWTVMGNEICSTMSGLPNSPISVPQQTQCFSWGTVSQLGSPDEVDSAYQQYLSYRAGQQLGAGVGSLIGALLRVWTRHHRRIVMEKRDVHTQILAYMRSLVAMNDESHALWRQDMVLLTAMSSLPAPNGAWAADLAPRLQMRYQSVWAAWQRLKAFECKHVVKKGHQPLWFLRDELDDPHGLKWQYKITRNALRVDWMSNRAFAFRQAILSHSTVIPAPQVKESYADVCSE